jgi:site-specific DNA recombinase
MSLDPTGKEAGVTRQLEESRRKAAELGLTVVHELSDNDISATTGKVRPGFQALVKLVEKGLVDTVVVWHPDRLYRVLKDLVPLMDLAQRRGLSIVSVTAGEMDLNTPHGRMMAGILGSISTNEGEHKSERMRLAYKDRATRGHWNFTHRPYAYQRATDGSVVQVSTEATILREMYSRFYDGGESRHAIAKDLNARGHLTTNGNPWTVSKIRDTLENPANAGFIRYQGEIVGKGLHEGVITEDEWEAYHGSSSKRNTVSTFSKNATSLLSGLIACGVCGGKVYRKARATGKYEYSCSVKRCVSIGASDADKAVRSEVLSALLLGPADLVPVDEHGVSLTGLAEALRGLEGRRSAVLSLVAEGLASLASVRPQLEALKVEEAVLIEQRDDLSRENVAAEVLLGIKGELFAGGEASLTRAVEARRALGDRFDALTLNRQRDLVGLLLRIVLFRGKGIQRLAMTHRIVTSLNESEEMN